MIIFRNPGLIDLDAVRTMGVSVKRPGSFGYFGTGLKFALATILRGGGDVTLHRGEKAHRFTKRTKEIRGEPFELVCMDGKAMGFTTQLGKNWEPWMVLRELGCNAMDEGGTFFKLGDDAEENKPDETHLYVAWPALDKAYEDRGGVFFSTTGAEREVIRHDDSLEIAAGRSKWLYYRGVRALKLEHESAFTYNVLAQQTLSEDRHLVGDWSANGIVRKHWLSCDDQEILKRVLVLPAQKDDWFDDSPADPWERHVDWNNDYESIRPSKAFIDVCYEASSKNYGGRLSPAARDLFYRSVRKQAKDGGYSNSRRFQDAFTLALEAVGEMFDHVIPAQVLADGQVLYQSDPLGIENAKFVLLDDPLPKDELSMCEDGRIYISRELLRQPKRTIAEHIIRGLIEASYLDPMDTLVPLALQNHSYTRIALADRRPEPQEDEPMSEVEAVIRQEFLGEDLADPIVEEE